MPEPLAGESLVAVIENGGEIIATWQIHRQLHLDNGCIAEKWRGRFLNLKRLYALLESSLPPGQRIYSTASSENGAKILSHINFKPYPFPLFTKRIE